MISQFLNFDKLIGTKLIKVVYWLGLLGLCLFGIGSVFASFAAMGSNIGAGLGTLLVAIITFIFGVIFWRFICELYLLLFRMSDDIRDIKNDQLGLAPNKTNIDSEIA